VLRLRSSPKVNASTRPLMRMTAPSSPSSPKWLSASRVASPSAQIFLAQACFAPVSGQVDARRQMRFVHGLVNRLKGAQQVIEMVPLGAVALARQFDQIPGGIDIVEMVPHGLDVELRAPRQLGDESAVRPVYVRSGYASLLPDPLEEHARHAGPGRRADGRQGLDPVPRVAADDEQPFPVSGPQETIMGPPHEQVGETELGRLGLILPQLLLDKVPVFEADRLEIGKFRRHKRNYIHYSPGFTKAILLTRQLSVG